MAIFIPVLSIFVFLSSSLLAINMSSLHFKHILHFAQAVLIVASMGLTIPRFFMEGYPNTKENTIALSMVRVYLLL